MYIKNSCFHKSHTTLTFFFVYFVLIINLFDCSSKIRKTFDQEGELRQIHFTDKQGKTHIFEFVHNKKQRTLIIDKKSSPEMTPIMNMKIRYGTDGRINFISKKTFAHESSKHEAEYDSFTYSKSGEVLRIDTSYKSAYSIAKHNTALIIAQYKYRDGILSEIVENAGTYKHIIKPVYSGNEIQHIEFQHFAFQSKTRTFEKTKELQFVFSNNNIRKAIDKTTKKEFRRDDAYKMFIQENAGRALTKLKFGRTIDEFLKHPETLLLNEM